MKDILNKYCVKTFGVSGAIKEIGLVKKVAGRTIHVDWGMKVWIYQNKDFQWIPISKEELEAKYRKHKFTEEALKRAAALGIEVND
ncbi:hypothetical protein [Paenibacillus albus]|uniref:Uncharacterized protein n=1 Tax=Paenibacillus albus TaxID=2495582 RepID=A0A3Q8X6N9_9BACL|nr:hypothetical protein [Paenibacillus albus]AZN40041.1 hypothetical protein EJC50_10545 [Paenibacillus albus]